MDGVKDTAVGAILEIPPSALEKIDEAEKAIKQLGATSTRVARSVSKDWGETALTGLDAFIKKVKEANWRIGGLKMPTIDSAGFASSISEIATAMASVDKSATTGSKRIERIADAVSKLSATTPSYAAFKDIADGITLIGSTSDATIAKVSTLAATMATLARDIRTVTAARSADAEKTASASQYNKLYKEQQQILRETLAINRKGADATIDELNKLSAMKKRYSEIEAQLDRLNKKKQTASSALARVTGVGNVGRTADISSAKGAINYAQQAKSLKELQDAYKNLKTVMSTVDPKSKDWQQMNVVLQQTKSKIDSIRKAMVEFQNQSKMTGDSLGKLKGQIATAFSVAAIMGYIRKMVEVRGEFELQNVALRAILQNKDEADKIFMQVQNMALQSPFSIMQMTTFTKQLAAYRIESEKLVGTTKMLADVSAGLGVDMGRLILAYGQVKSANYLRATEIRQFTEAGLNIADELAQYFSELQGKMVSVGDVMEMVTKRMVRFEDVEEVFKRVTSAGGLFYDMQKKQSNTISGMLQRITDAWQIMLNDIGKSNQGLIRGALDLIRQMISHWRMLVPVIKTVGTLMAVAFATKGIYAALMGMTKIAASIKAITGGLNAMRVAAQTANLALSTTGIGALITLGLTLTAVFFGLREEANKLREALSEVQREGTSDMYNLIFQYRQLADVVRDSTKTYAERKEALDTLHRTYKDILPSEMLEIENIRKMSDGYKEAVQAIEEFSAIKIKQKMYDTIDSEYGSKLTSAIAHDVNDLTDVLYDQIKKISDYPKDEVKGAINNIMTTLTEEIKNGSVKLSDLDKEFKQRLYATLGLTDKDIAILKGSAPKWDDFFKKYFEGYNVSLTKFGNQIDSELIEVFDKINKERGKITDLGLPGVTVDSKTAEKVIKQYKDAEQVVTDYKNALQRLKDEGITDVSMDRKDIDEMQKSALEAYDEASKAMGSYKLGIDEVNTALSSNMDMHEALRNVSVNAITAILNNLEKEARAIKNDTLLAWVQRMQREISKLNLTPAQQEIVNIIHEVENLNNVDLGNFQFAIIESTTTVTDARKNVENQIKQLEESIEAYKNSTLTQVAPAVAAMWFLQGKSIEETKEQLEALKAVWGKLGGGEKKTTGGKGKDPWQDRLSLFKEINTEYEKLLKNYSEEESKQRIQMSYAKAVAEIFKGQGKFGDIKNWLGFDKDSMIEIGQQMLDTLNISSEKRKDMEKQLAGLKATVDVKIQEDSVKDMEKYMQKVADNFELSETFRKLGVPIELTYSLGGKPTTLADQRRELEDNYYEIFKVQKKYGEEGEKAYDKIQQDIAKKEQKNLEERAKNYIKYLTESMGERAQIEIKALQDVNKIREDETLDSFSKEQAIMQRRKKMYEDLSKMDLDSLKSSDVYISVFKDLERASKEQLQYVLNKLRELQSTFKDLSPAQVKSIANEMKKIEDALASKDSVKNLGRNLKDAIEYARQRNDLLREQTRLQTLISNSDNALKVAQKDLYDLTLKRDAIQDKSSEEWKDANDAVLKQQMYVAGLEAQIKALQAELEKVTGKINKGTNAWAGFREGMTKVAQYIDATKQALDDVFEGIGAVFNIDDATRDTFDSVSEIMGGISKTANGLAEIDLTRPFTLITGLGKAIGGVFSTIGGFFGIGDKKKERDIQKLTEKVEALDKEYQRLEKSIEKAYTFSDYKAGYRQMQQTLEAEKTAYQEMLALEKAKKKTDDAKVKEYEEKLEDLAEKQKELQKSLIEDFGSTTDYRGAAEDFVSAWLDAFKDTGDGLDALDEHWQEFIQNLFIKQAALAKAGDVYKDVIDIINNAMTKGKTDFDLKDAIAQAQEAASKGNEYMNDYLKALAEAFNIRPNANGELILSDLQKGIQNITEPQAAAIEAYLNSMRFAVFRHTEQLDTLIATIQMQYGSGAENPVVTELKGIRGVLDNIYKDLHSVINTQGRNATIRIGAS